MILYHGSNISIDKINLEMSKPNKDFGKGFYLSENENQALEMAQIKSVLLGGEPIVTKFEFDVAVMNSSELCIKIFDEYTTNVPRLPLPEYLCIDEKHFEGDTDGKYCVVLSDFFTGEVVDILPNRQMSYLEAYFSNIKIFERNRVKVFISDMYEGYSRIKNKYFPKAMFVIDLFHVVKLLTAAVNKVRIRTYNQIAIDDTIERHFLKTNWRYFLMNERYISNKFYKYQKDW